MSLATGQTPRRVYAKLVVAAQEGKVSFAEVETINLDEYCGLGQSHPDSFAAYMHRELFSGAGFDASRINLIDGAAPDETAEAARYASLVRSRPADLQVLGIGTGDILPVARWRCDHFTTDDTAMSNRSTTTRQLCPAATAATTRSRRSFE